MITRGTSCNPTPSPSQLSSSTLISTQSGCPLLLRSPLPLVGRILSLGTNHALLLHQPNPEHLDLQPLLRKILLPEKWHKSISFPQTKHNQEYNTICSQFIIFEMVPSILLPPTTPNKYVQRSDVATYPVLYHSQSIAIIKMEIGCAPCCIEAPQTPCIENMKHQNLLGKRLALKRSHRPSHDLHIPRNWVR